MPNTEPPDTARRERTLSLAADLYTNHRRRLLAIATRNSPTIDDAEEALHDSFALFIDHFHPDTGAPPLAWLTLTLKRRCWACYRHQLLTKPVSPHSPTAGLELSPSRAPLPDEIAELADTTALLRRGLKALKPHQRQALSLLALGYSYREIADITGWTYTKVNRCITEGRATLRTSQLSEATSAPAPLRGAKTWRP